MLRRETGPNTLADPPARYAAKQTRPREAVGLVGVLAILVLAFGLTADRFLTPTTLVAILNQAPEAVILATAMTLVIVTGSIDLSVGSVLALSAAVLGVLLSSWQLPLPLALLAALTTGAACGLLSGWLTTRWRLPSFVVTLAVLEMARGATYLVTDSRTMYLGTRTDRLATDIAFGLRAPVLIALIVVCLTHLLLTRFVLGRHLVAIGANEESARLAGVRVDRVRQAAFVASGLLAGLAAIVQAGRLAAADPNAGIGLELEAIAAVVIGGTSLAGGRGSVLTSALGALIIAVLGAGLAHVGVQEPTRRLVTGAVIVIAAITDALRRRHAGLAGANK